MGRCHLEKDIAFRNERVTGRKVRGLQTEKLACSVIHFYLSSVAGGKKLAIVFASQFKFGAVSMKILCCYNDTWFHLNLTIRKP